MKPTITWVLIADGTQAQVFENTGPGKGLQPVKGLRFDQEPLRAQDINTDRPGRQMGRGPAAKSGMEQSDPVKLREERFVKGVAEQLDLMRRNSRFERLIIAAAPTALGDIRPALTHEVRDAVIAELPKDLTNVPRPQLDKHFDGLLAL